MRPDAQPDPLGKGPGADSIALESENQSQGTPSPGEAVQQDIFNYPPDRGTARKGDPDTSREAAKSLDSEKLRGLQREVLDVLVARGGSGTLDDVVGVTGRQRGSTSRRLTDLETGGLIRRTGEKRAGYMTGRKQIVWAVVDDG